MFDAVPAAPPDPILGLTDAFNADPMEGKINLGVGVFKDASGHTPILGCVKEAEQLLLEIETTKGYLPIDGDPAYAAAVQGLLLGEGSAIVDAGRAATSHTPGGTGGLRVVGDYLHQQHPAATLWHSDPTWANHPSIFEAAGVPTKTYAYYDPAANALDFDAMRAALAAVPAGDVVLLHGCCHNPTGVDLAPQQWERVASLLAERGVLPLIDFAYQGFAEGLEEDAAGLRAVCGVCDDVLVCSSFSKNFGLYRERVGALTVIAKTADAAAAVQSQVKVCIRRNYSNPPAHGGSIVAAVLKAPALRERWLAELAMMRGRIHGMRALLRDKLDARGINLSPGGNAFITEQRGMFSYSGLTREQVRRLRDDHHVYVVGSGRINVAGITEANADRLCDAIAAVVV